MNLSHLPIFDHHAHPLHRRATTDTVAGFRRWFGETLSDEVRERHLPHTLVFRVAIKWLADYLQCAPTVEAVLAARAQIDEQRWAQQLFRDANITTLVLDYGLRGEAAYDHAGMQAILPDVPILQMPRIERVAEDLIVQLDSFGQMIEAFIDGLEHARAHGAVALKSIAAYRTGLEIHPSSATAAAAIFPALKEEANRTGRVRLNHKPFNDYLVELALQVAQRQQMPFQFHTGFGDSDADLRWANPLHLRRVIEQYEGVPFVLLHAGWPYYRELSHWAAIYPNVWMDLSLAVPFATTGIPSMIREVLGMAPFSKVLFATDAFTMAEIFWIAAKWGRWGLGNVLDEFVAEGFLGHDEALDAAQAILHDNARQLYLGG